MSAETTREAIARTAREAIRGNARQQAENLRNLVPNPSDVAIARKGRNMAIAKMHKAGFSLREIAEAVDLSHSAVAKILAS